MADGPATRKASPRHNPSLPRVLPRPVVTGALLGLALLAVAFAITVHIANDPESKLPADDKAEVDRADCGKLLGLHFAYLPNADSVPSAQTGLIRVDRRRKALGCAPIAIDEMTASNIQQRDCGSLDALAAQYTGVSAQFAQQTLTLVALAKADRC